MCPAMVAGCWLRARARAWPAGSPVQNGRGADARDGAPAPRRHAHAGHGPATWRYGSHQTDRGTVCRGAHRPLAITAARLRARACAWGTTARRTRTFGLHYIWPAAVLRRWRIADDTPVDGLATCSRCQRAARTRRFAALLKGSPQHAGLAPGRHRCAPLCATMPAFCISFVAGSSVPDRPPAPRPLEPGSGACEREAAGAVGVGTSTHASHPRVHVGTSTSHPTRVRTRSVGRPRGAAQS